MIKFSKRARCALEAVLDIALSARPEPICASHLTARQHISKRYLERIMQELVRADILTGHRGPRGGYRLARERRRITLGEIFRALDEMEEKRRAVSPLGQNIIEPLCAKLNQEMMRRLDAITVEDLTINAENIGLTDKSASRVDFNI